MAKIKYDVSDVEVGAAGGPQAPVGLYKATIKSAVHRTAKSNGDPANDIEVILDIGEDYANLFTYIGLEPQTQWKLRELTDALGMPSKGELDPTKLIGKKLQVKVQADTYQGEYRARAGRLLKLGSGQDASDPTDDDDDDDDDDDVEPEASAAGSDDYEDWDLDDLKAEIEEKGIEVKGRKTKEKLIAALQEAAGSGDADDDDEPEDDYDEWELEELVTEIEERKLEYKGRKTKDKAISILRADDKENPF